MDRADEINNASQCGFHTKRADVCPGKPRLPASKCVLIIHRRVQLVPCISQELQQLTNDFATLNPSTKELWTRAIAAYSGESTLSFVVSNHSLVTFELFPRLQASNACCQSSNCKQASNANAARCGFAVDNEPELGCVYTKTCNGNHLANTLLAKIMRVRKAMTDGLVPTANITAAVMYDAVWLEPYPAEKFTPAYLTLAGQLDVLSFNTYSYFICPTTPVKDVPTKNCISWANQSLTINLFATLRSAMLQANMAKELWISEAGWSAAPIKSTADLRTGGAQTSPRAKCARACCRRVFKRLFNWRRLFDCGALSSILFQFPPFPRVAVRRRSAGPQHDSCPVPRIHFPRCTMIWGSNPLSCEQDPANPEVTLRAPDRIFWFSYGPSCCCAQPRTSVCYPLPACAVR